MGQNWAITIGIDKYQYITPLKFAKRDADSLANFCAHDLEFTQIYHFTESSCPIQQEHGPALQSQPTYGTLRRFLRTRFERPCLGLGDNLWFFFAGHGIRHQERDYLIPIDGDLGDIENTALSIYFVTEALRRSGAGNVMLLVDACRSQDRRAGIGIGQEEQRGVISIFSCSPEESSFEIKEIQHGSFTYSLLKGLRIQGKNNCATVERLYQYLRHQVPKLNEKYGKPVQNPYGVIEPPTKYHLILLPKQANIYDVEILKKDALSAEVQQNFALAKQLWIRVLAISPADPEGIAGIERTVLVLEQKSQDLSQKIEQKLTKNNNKLPIANQSSDLLPLNSNFQHKSTENDISVPSRSSLVPIISRQTLEFKVVSINEEGERIDHTIGKVSYRSVKLSQYISLDLVLIPSGRFLMGSHDSELGRQEDESPQNEVTVNTFLMSKYPVTQAQWLEVANLPQVNCEIQAKPSYFKGSKRPVEMISWYDAIEFCNRLSKETGNDYRLPSEAEWEYACRSGMATPYHFGHTITSDIANYNGNMGYGLGPTGIYRRETTEVGVFDVANSFGLYDMHGNVLEWCLDNWHRNYKGCPKNSGAWLDNGDSDLRVLRGGAWSLYPHYCRSANRCKAKPDARSSRIGFRIACSSSMR